MLNFVSKNLRHWLIEKSPKEFAAGFNPLNRFIWRHPIRVAFEPSPQVLRVEDGRRAFRFCRNSRVQRYYRGIDPFLTRLCQDYMLHEIGLKAGDTIVDCGANVGEVSAGLLLREPALRLIAVEPEELEANCADLNLFEGKRLTLRKALWRECTTLNFYSAPDTADSSLFETAMSRSVKQVEAVTLDSVLDQSGVNRVRILKLEAEGAEPEILEGAQNWLPRIDYIAADLGLERGLKQEQTATPVINHLLARGFDLVDMRFDRVVCLFRNRASEFH